MISGMIAGNEDAEKLNITPDASVGVALTPYPLSLGERGGLSEFVQKLLMVLRVQISF
jgi:hypothetical protein